VLWLAVLGLLVSGTSPGWLASAQAQDAEVPAENDVAANAAAAEERGANSPDLDAADTAPKTYLQWAYRALGLKYTVVFLGLSVTMVALVVMLIVELRRANICPPELVEGFEQHLQEKRYQEAYELAKADESYLGSVLSAGMANVNAGYPSALEAMQEVGEEEAMKLEHRLSLIQLIGTISPMVGLYGTVDGMIASFRQLTTPGVTPKPWELAWGVSTALFTTLLGLAIAIPTIAIFNVLKNRLARLVFDVGVLSEGLMKRFDTTPVARN
jgi:biopolymer transport protein ExbB